MKNSLSTVVVQSLYGKLRRSFAAGGESTGPLKLSGKKLTLYIHFPFCDTICRYCPFSRTITNDDVDVYMQALFTELKKLKSEGQIEGSTISSMAFGGGTPSLIPDKHLRTLMILLEEYFPGFTTIQKTMECTPESITKERLALFEEVGINRLSIGVQSLQQSVLDELGRESSPELIHEKLALVDQHWSGTWSCDLIYGFESHTDDQFLDDLTELADLGAHHLTMFPLVNSDANNRQSLSVKQFRRMKRMHKEASKLVSTLGFSGYSVEDYTRSEEAMLQYQKDIWHYPQLDALILGSGGLGICGSTQYRKSKSRTEYLQKIAAGHFPLDRYLPMESKREKIVRSFLGLHYNEVPSDRGLNIYPVLRIFGIAYKKDGMIKLTEHGRFVMSLLWAKIMVDRMIG